MPPPARLVPPLLALLALAGPAPTRADDPSARLKRGATDLFRAVAPPMPLEPCGLSAEWSTDPVPAEVARRRLGVMVHADLLAPHHGTSPAEIVDPAGRMPHAFCDAAIRRRETERRAAFERTATDGGPSSVLHLGHTTYGFPIFAADFRRAVLVRTMTGQSWSRTDGRIKPTPLAGAAVAEVYGKKRGRWRLIAREVLGIS